MLRLLSFCSAKKKVTKKKAALRHAAPPGSGAALRVMLCFAVLYSASCRFSDPVGGRRSVFVKDISFRSLFQFLLAEKCTIVISAAALLSALR
jgi:hypothetical protein